MIDIMTRYLVLLGMRPVMAQPWGRGGVVAFVRYRENN